MSLCEYESVCQCALMVGHNEESTVDDDDAAEVKLFLAWPCMKLIRVIISGP